MGPGRVVMEFHVSRQARERYRLEEGLFALSDSLILVNFQAARELAHRMNQRPERAQGSQPPISPGQLNAMGLIDELLHRLVARYREQENPQLMAQALSSLEGTLGPGALDRTLRRFAEEFPSLSVYRRESTAEEYLGGATDGIPHRELLLEELLMLWLANANPAFAPFRELFDDAVLRAEAAYTTLITHLQGFLGGQTGSGPDGASLLEQLLSPAQAFPHSLTAQLEYIQRRWGLHLGVVLARVLTSLDLLREEERPVFAGPGPAQVAEYGRQEVEAERFSPDLDWMPRLVLLAKNAYVWLDQLGQRYRQPVHRLDQIPDEELERLSRWGISGLWLIGLWERSPASRRIKQLCGNPEAVASAYSLYDYQIAAGLGGEDAFRRLKERAAARGIRMASDMVPNHVGIYSRWVVEHPDWFISLHHNPFPAYRFSGPDLSHDDRVGIFLEGHYYDRSDAAVVFRRLDRWTGEETYVYHGNDGTSMPWNDTAQLNYLNPKVREAVIQTILHVARQTPIIRFDAAMTLTRKHYQRLWFPEPGSGGAIPTRAEHGLTRAEFDAAMPAEFWREVVDRVAAEAPDTLLLAEAFWLLEGYFVRTLGMHRVYNSAFMHMLRDEENAKYRTVLKNTLEFDPEVLKRFVNFMSNPDEETSVAQFGKGDKYFGICTLMATLPGLPMFGHGQVEGLTERYGMEYRRAYLDEQPDEELEARHSRQLFPLLHRRSLFADVDQFLLYDLFTPEGTVNEDVFAYSNRAGEECALVLYHNRFAGARGWVRRSAAYSVRTGQGDLRRLVQRSLGEGLGLHPEPDRYCLFRDQVTGLEYIRSSQALCQDGLYVELDAYECRVFLDWREVQDSEGQPYAELERQLSGRGVSSLTDALEEMRLRPVHEPFRALVNAQTFGGLTAALTAAPDGPLAEALLGEVEKRTAGLLQVAWEAAGKTGDAQEAARQVPRGLEAGARLPALARSLPGDAVAVGAAREPEPGSRQEANEILRSARNDMLEALGQAPDRAAWGTLLGWLILRALGEVAGGRDAVEGSAGRRDEWRLGPLLAEALREAGLDDAQARDSALLVQILAGRQDWLGLPGQPRVATALRSWLRDDEVRRFLRVNLYQDVVWFHKEPFEQLLEWALRVTAVGLCSDPSQSPSAVAESLLEACRVAGELRQAEERSGYQLARLEQEAGLPPD